MTIAYDVTLDDVVAFNRYHVQHAPGMRRYLGWARFGAASLALIGVWSLVAYLQYDSRSIPALLLGLGAAVIAYRVAPALLLRSLPRGVRRMVQDARNRGMTGPQRLTLTPDGLTLRSDVGDQRYPWDTIERVAATPEHVFIYVTPISALVVPSRAFDNEAERTVFLDAARSSLPASESPVAAGSASRG